MTPQPKVRTGHAKMIRFLARQLENERAAPQLNRDSMEVHRCGEDIERVSSKFASKFKISVEQAVDQMITLYGLNDTYQFVHADFSPRLLEFQEFEEYEAFMEDSTRG